MPLKLMIPGPIDLEDDVLAWMGAPTQVHYGDEWVAQHNETIDLLKRVLKTSGRTWMLPGSGSLAGDAIVQSAFSPGQKVAVGINGWFGERSRDLLAANGIETVIIEAQPGELLDPAEFDRVLAADSSIVGVAVVHLETSTAVLNPVREIGEIVRKHNRLYMVDTVSSLGGVEFDMDAWGVDLCFSASQKGLGGAAGIAICAVSERGWQAIDSQPERPRSWYLNLKMWQWYVENWGDWHPHPVTMPCAVILGLRAALQNLFRDGLDNRLRGYDALAARLRGGLQDMGMELFVPVERMSSVLTAAYCPPGIPSSQIVNYLANEHSIKITAGFGPFKEKVIRIGHMGGAIDEARIDELLAALRQFMQEAVSE